MLLAASAGSADSWAYFGLGHAFVANMTGNTVLLGLTVFQNRDDLLHLVIALLCYSAGVMNGSLLARGVNADALWAKAVSWTLMLEAVLLVAAEAGWIAIHLHARHAPTPNELLGTLALAVGMQSAAMLQLKIPGIVTTYITGTWTTLLSGVARFAKDRRQREPAKNVEFDERLLMQGAVLAAYFLSAVLAGWLFRYHPLAVGALPAAATLVVALYGVLWARASSG
jgi:uncharacterized membrane protein YoaK (UPF0700 family)